MKANIFSLLIVLSLLTLALAVGEEVKAMEKHHGLNRRQQSIIPIAAFTADGDINRLKPALNQGLDNGLTVNETKEILVHLYAYTGFPRSLNALFAFMGVMDERKAKGIDDAVGKEAGPIPPDMDTFLKEHLLADLFVRDVISHQDRELATISALANMKGTEG
jgi:4-carboxymuconolactone decarboxylase